MYACIYIPSLLSLSLVLEKVVDPALEAISGDPPAAGHRGHGGSGRRGGLHVSLVSDLMHSLIHLFVS